jgi:hypothetical protein
MRVVSLLPSATEIVCALGAGGELVGISHECDHPPEVVTGLPALTVSRISMDGDSGRIDRSVRELLRAALAIYVWSDIRTVAAALGRQAAGETLLAELRGRLERVKRRTAGAPPAGGQHRVAGPGDARRHLDAGVDHHRRRRPAGGDGGETGPRRWTWPALPAWSLRWW